MFHLGQLPTCPTPYYGPYTMESGSPCTYKDINDQCCDPTNTFPQTPKPPATQPATQWIPGLSNTMVMIAGGVVLLILMLGGRR